MTFFQTSPEAPGVRHWPGFIPPPAATLLLDRLLAETPWRARHIRLFGRTLPVPRLTAWTGDFAYRYAGLDNPPRPWTPCLAALRQTLSATLDHPFDGVLLNLYRNGADSMAWHGDDEPVMGERPLIASVSLGATRRMRFRPRPGQGVGQTATAPTSFGVDLAHGDLLLMAGDTQQRWQHCIAKTRKPVGPRINLTFRCHRTAAIG